MAKNFIPFAAREVLVIPAGETRTSKVTATAIGTRSPKTMVHLQDLCVWFPGRVNSNTYSGGFPATSAYEDQVYMRLGMRHLGYLTDRAVPVGAFTNEGRPQHATWNFIKPYTIYPGEAITARIIQGGQDNSEISDGDSRRWAGLTLNAVRTRDGQPAVIYGVVQEVLDRGDERPIQSVRLKCPSDSPVQIYGMSHHLFFDAEQNPSSWLPLGIEVFSPNGEPFLKKVVNPATTLGEQYIIGCWIDPPNSLIALGPDRGWSHDASTNILVQLENRDTSNSKQIVVTVRGFVEDTNE